MARANVNGLQVSYRVQGEGPTLLLIAGTGYAGGTWSPALLDDLAVDHTVISFDHRGTGSTRGDTGFFSTRTLAQDALGLLTALDAPSAHVLGHSMGGRVAQWMALDGGEQVTSLILAASGPGAHPGTPGHTWGVPVHAAAGMVRLGYQRYIDDVQRRTFFTEAFAAEQPMTAEWLLDAFWDSRPSLVDYFKHVAARQQHDTVDLLGDIGQPTLLLVGDQDTHQGGTGSHLEQSERLAQGIPGAIMTILPGVKHGFLWQAPAESAALVRRWLADLR